MRAVPPPPAAGDELAWQTFLSLLAPEDDRAATEYAALRRRLVDLFRWRGLAGAEDLADEAIERAVRQVKNGEQIRSVAGYVCGIAQRLALEASRREARVSPLDDRFAVLPATSTTESSDRLDSLERCLDRLPSGSRELVLRYYAMGPGRIAARRQLADELGIGLNALRIRVHRLRLALETCLGRREEDEAA